jgi:hypothetical protein
LLPHYADEEQLAAAMESTLLGTPEGQATLKAPIAEAISTFAALTSSHRHHVPRNRHLIASDGE